MEVKVTQIDPCKTELNIEVEAEKIVQASEAVFQDYAKNAAIPGFRKGKAPRAIVERAIDPDAFKESVVDSVLGPAYYEAIEKEKIDPYSSPEIEIVQYELGQPFIFKAFVPLPPKVELGDYKGIEVERRKVEITDEDVEAQLKRLQESKATVEPVEDRGVGENDVVIANITSAPKGEALPEARRSLIRMGDNVPGFDESITGLKPGEQRSFEIVYSEDFNDKELAGKTYEFSVAVESLRERKVPALDDTFAKTMGDFENLDAMRADVRKYLEESANETADKEVEHKIIDEIVARSTVCFPDAMLNHEVHHDIEDLGRNLATHGLTIEQYLARTNKSQEDLIKEVKDEAEKRLQIGLVLGEVAEVEKLDVTDEEVDAEIDRIAESSKSTREAVEEFLKERGGKSSLKNSLLNKKITDLLLSVSVIK